MKRAQSSLLKPISVVQLGKHLKSKVSSEQGGQRFIPWGRLMGALVPDAILSSDLSAGAKLAYGLLCRFGGRDGRAFPTIKTLSNRLSVCETQVKTYLAELRRKGYIEQERGGNGEPSRYYFLWRTEFKACEWPDRRNSAPQTDGIPPTEGIQLSNYDLDYLPADCEMRNPRSGGNILGVAPSWPMLAELASKLLGRRLSNSSIGRIISATPAKLETEAIEAIEDAERRGYGAESRRGPNSASWFVSVVQAYWQDRLQRSLPPKGKLIEMKRADFDSMSEILQPLSDAA